MLNYAVEFDHFSLKYGTNEVLKNLNLAIPQGTCLGIIGPNGSGKTSLLRSIAGLVQPASGEVKVFGHPPKRSWRRRKPIGYVPQWKSIDRDFPISVYEVVMLGRIGHIGLFHTPKEEDHAIVRNVLQRVNMLELAKRPIGQLSGGQQQRVFIARALAQEADILLLDEPGTGLDIPTQESIYRLLEELHSDGITTLTATHDLMALEFHRFDRILCLNKRIIACGPPDAVLTPEILAKTFSGVPWPRQLARSAP